MLWRKNKCGKGLHMPTLPFCHVVQEHRAPGPDWDSLTHLEGDRVSLFFLQGEPLVGLATCYVKF